MGKRAGDEAAACAQALLKTSAGRKKASPSNCPPKSGAAASEKASYTKATAC
jgi:hypothetical protein